MALVNYDIDFTKMITQLLPVVLRKPIRISWLNAVLKRVRTLHTEFIAYRNLIIRDIKWNGQTIKLENLLVERFGSGIYITNKIVSSDAPMIGAGDDLDFYIGEGDDQTDFLDIDYNISTVNFIVNVPGSLVFTMSEMIALIEKYKMFSTTYSIVIV